MSLAVRDFFANGGTDAAVVRLGGRGGDAPDGALLTASDIVGPGLEEDGRGRYPPPRGDRGARRMSPPHTRDGGVDPEVVRAADAYCSSRRAIRLLDGLPSWTGAGDVLAACASGLDEHVDEFMHGLFREGAFPGSSRPSDGSFVKCGRDTMTEHDIERGALTVTVGFAPIRPGEFVVVRVQQAVGASR